jgi:hypothetical protein
MGQSCFADADCCDAKYQRAICSVRAGASEKTCCAPLNTSYASAASCCSGTYDSGDGCCLPLHSPCALPTDCCGNWGLQDVTCGAIGGVGATVCCKSQWQPCGDNGECCSNVCKKTGSSTTGACQ